MICFIKTDVGQLLNVLLVNLANNEIFLLYRITSIQGNNQLILGPNRNNARFVKAARRRFNVSYQWSVSLTASKAQKYGTICV